ncbi:MAG: succinate dehydrogenase cytochrome b subunit [Saprospiraceae bacterium]
MSWLTNFLFSSIGRKLIMSLTGIFLILFLTVHLVGNLQLLIDDGGEQFNLYAKMMTSNPLIQIISIGNFFFIFLHAVIGILLYFQNKAASGGGSSRYAVKSTKTTTYSSRNMAWFGTVILVFILIHLYQYWFKMKLGMTDMITYDGMEVKNLYILVAATFSSLPFVLFYVASMAVIGMHLYHGFQSAFQTLGLNHKKYTPFINGLGTAYSILIPLGFAIIPIVFYLTKA